MANNYSAIQALINAGNKMGLSNTITRDNGIPLDASSIYASYNDAVIYAATKAIAYEGQIIAVTENGDTTVYVITPASQGTVTINETAYEVYIKAVGVAKDPAGDNKSISVAEDGTVSIYGFAAAADATLPQKQADGTIKWVPIGTIVQGDGNTKTVVTGNGAASVTSAYDEDTDTYTYTVDVTMIDAYTKGEADAKFALKSELYDDTALQGRVKAIEDDYINQNKLTAALTVKANVADVYTKDEVYTKEEANTKIAEEIANANHLSTKVADSVNIATNKVTVEGVEEDAVSGIIYLVADESAEVDDKYFEYVVIDDVLTLIGSTATDLKDYAKTADVNSLISAAETRASVYTDNAIKALNIGDYAKTADVNSTVEEINNAISGINTEISTVKTSVNTAKSEAITEAVTQAGTNADGKIAAALASYTNTADLTALLANKADKGTTLEDYGIEDAYNKGETYNKTQIDALLEGIQAGSSESAASVNTKLEAYIETNDARVGAVESKLGTVEGGAQVNKIESFAGITATVANKVATVTAVPVSLLVSDEVLVLDGGTSAGE